MKRVRATSRATPDTAKHPIAVVAERTGLTQDVLRVWERRYSAVRPARGTGGQRLYTNADVERLILLSAAAGAGRSIGQIARLSTAVLTRMVKEDAAARDARAPYPADSIDAEHLVTTGLALTRSLQATQLDGHLRRAAALLGVTAFAERVAAPLLQLVGDEWHAGRLTSAQEHVASSILHDILVGTMRGFAAGNGAPRVLVATLAGERHAIGAVLAGAFAAVEGWNVIYLGTDLPATEIAAAAITAQAPVVALSIVYVDDPDRVLGEVRALRASLPKSIQIMAGGSGAALLARELAASGVRVAGTVDELFVSFRGDDGQT